MKSCWWMIALAAALMPCSSAAQGERDSAQNSVALRAGYAMPLGDWRQSPSAPSVNLIIGSFALEADLEFAIANRWTLAVEGGYWSLNGSDWESYVRAQGEAITLSGSFTHVSILLRPHLKVTRPDIVRAEFGAALMIASGKEVYDGRTYPYDFLGGTSFGMQGGLEYMRVLSASVALTLKAGMVFFPAAVQHVGAPANAMLFVPVTAGVRFLL